VAVLGRCRTLFSAYDGIVVRSVLLSLAGALAPLTLGGCTTSGGDASSLQMRVSALQQEQTARQYELQQIAAQIEAARRELARQQCLAFTASIDAEVSATAADCMAKRSKFAQCEANNHAHTAEGGVLGCLAGLGAAVVTGGAAAPLTVIGCGGGAALGHASGSECGPDPVCTPDRTILTREALGRRGISAMPACQ